jgi:hypothetical protein
MLNKNKFLAITKNEEKRSTHGIKPRNEFKCKLELTTTIFFFFLKRVSTGTSG